MSPVYDYQCEGCGHILLNEKRRIYEEYILCPVCGKSAHRVPVYREQVIRGDTVAKG